MGFIRFKQSLMLVSGINGLFLWVLCLEWETLIRKALCVGEEEWAFTIIIITDSATTNRKLLRHVQAEVHSFKTILLLSAP